jgi:CheY-like chemotaxis protein
MARLPVLYVEDEEDDIFFMRTAFNKAGMLGLHAEQDGKSAMDYLTAQCSNGERPRVILLDINLPLVSGFEVLHWIRQQPLLRDVPVVVFSSSGRPEDRSRAEELGADEYVLKPASGQEFLAVAHSIRARWFGSARD